MVRPRKFKKFFERVSGRGARGDCGGLVLARVRFPGGAHPHWGGPRSQAPQGQPVPRGFPRFLSGLGFIARNRLITGTQRRVVDHSALLPAPYLSAPPSALSD